jgi:DNA repair protein RadC
MKDSELLPVSQHDANAIDPMETPATVETRTVRRRSPTASDRTTRLVADVFGMTTDRAGAVLASLGGLEALAFASEAELVMLAVSRNRARLIRASFELARQSIGCRPQIGRRLAGASDVWMHMRARLSGTPVEEFWAIAMDVRHRVVMDSMIARGSLTGVEVHPRDVFRALIKAGAAAVIFCHNHPSGDPAPSRADIELTLRLREVGELCGIAVLDHVVVGAQGFVSLAERNWR